MEIYLEYAIIENLLVDGALLYLAQVAAGQKVSAWRLSLSALLGAVFAVLFPFLTVSPWLSYALKLTMGALLCIIAVKPQNGRGRYALTTLLFYAFSFCFGGGLTAVFETFDTQYYLTEGGGVLSSVPVGGLLAALAAFVALARWGIKRLYAKKRVRQYIFPCEIVYGEKRIKASGFIDTGNTAFYKGRAVCFVTPDILYQLFDFATPQERMTIRTVSGEKTIGLFPVDEIRLSGQSETAGLKSAYLSPAVHMLGKGYQVLLPKL